MTAKSDFPAAVQRLIEDLEADGFDVVYGETDPHDTPGFVADRGEAAVVVTDRVQTWFVTVEKEEGRVDDSYDRPADVAHEARRLLDAGGQR